MSVAAKKRAAYWGAIVCAVAVNGLVLVPGRTERVLLFVSTILLIVSAYAAGQQDESAELRARLEMEWAERVERERVEVRGGWICPCGRRLVVELCDGFLRGRVHAADGAQQLAEAPPS